MLYISHVPFMCIIGFHMVDSLEVFILYDRYFQIVIFVSLNIKEYTIIQLNYHNLELVGFKISFWSRLYYL